MLISLKKVLAHPASGLRSAERPVSTFIFQNDPHGIRQRQKRSCLQRGRQLWGEGFPAAVEKARARFKPNQQNQLETAGEFAVKVVSSAPPSIMIHFESVTTLLPKRWLPFTY